YSAAAGGVFLAAPAGSRRYNSRHPSSLAPDPGKGTPPKGKGALNWRRFGAYFPRAGQAGRRAGRKARCFMANQTDDSPSREQRLQDILLGYMQAVDAGQMPDRQDLLRQHPDLAADLQAFFADQDRLDRLARPLRPDPAPAALAAPVAEAPTQAPAEG